MLQSPFLQRLKDKYVWCLGTKLSDGIGSVMVMVGLDDLNGLFKPDVFYDSVKAFF